MIINLSGGGNPLPTLTNPASVGDIRKGKQAINGQGKLLDGNLDVLEAVSGTFNGDNSSTVTVPELVGKKYLFVWAYSGNYDPDYKLHVFLYVNGEVVVVERNNNDRITVIKNASNHKFDSKTGTISGNDGSSLKFIFATSNIYKYVAL